MKSYRAKKISRETSALQRRFLLIFWKTISYGPTYSITTAAISLERQKRKTQIRVHPRSSVVPLPHNPSLSR